MRQPPIRSPEMKPITFENATGLGQLTSLFCSLLGLAGVFLLLLKCHAKLGYSMFAAVGAFCLFFMLLIRTVNTACEMIAAAVGKAELTPGYWR